MQLKSIILSAYDVRCVKLLDNFTFTSFYFNILHGKIFSMVQSPSSINTELKLFPRFSLVLWPNFRECMFPFLSGRLIGWNAGNEQRACAEASKQTTQIPLVVLKRKCYGFLVQYALIDWSRWVGKCLQLKFAHQTLHYVISLLMISSLLSF